MPLKPEQIAHINVVNWFHEKYPGLADDFHHFANERKCTQQEGVTLKRMGVKKGVSDFHLAVPVEPYHGLWVELKIGRNTPTDEQQRFLDRKATRGYRTGWCVGQEAVKQFIQEYLAPYTSP